MTEFATETARHQQRVMAGGSFSFDFGPVTPGQLDVFLVATQPPFLWIDPGVFQIEVFDAQGRSFGTGRGPSLSLEVPAPVGLPGDGAAAPVVARATWRVEVTNISSFEANVRVKVRFRGVRPILSKPFELDFINDRFDLLFNRVQPLRLRFETRDVPFPGGFPLVWRTSFLVVDAIESWQVVHPELRDYDLGAAVFTEGTESTSITVRACVHDGSPAIRVRVRFRAGGVIDLINLLGIWSDTLADVAGAIAEVPGVDRPTVELGQMDLDVFFVLRPGFNDRQATFEVIAQPSHRGGLTDVARIFALAIFEFGLPRFLGEELDEFARTFAAWLLGERDRELLGGVEQLDITYIGDPPRPPVLAPTTVSPTTVPIDPGNLTKINRIVVVMMENRSFDHMLGYLSLPGSGNGDIVGRGRSDVDGLSGDEFNLSGRLDNQTRWVFPLSRPWDGPPVPDELRTRPTRFVPDPGHGYADTLAQRGGYDVELVPPDFSDPAEPEPGISVHIGPNGGFVMNFADRLSGIDDVALARQLAGEVMGQHPAEHVPTFDFLAEHYAVCDRWFAAHPGQTWPNRFASLTGRLNIGPDGLPEVDNPHSDTFDPPETETIVDHLLAAGVSCRYFEHDFCMLRVFSRYTFDDTVIAPIDDPARGFFALARAGNLPEVSFVEPDLTGIDVGNDDHPPADVTAGQLFLRRVYDALADGPREQQNGTLLLITYDEHGGFYDHVHPEEQQVIDTADPLKGGFVPIALDPQTLESVTHYGMRVPALVVSPWVPEGSVSSLVFDHTSILKTIIARFLAANPPDMGWRVALAEHVGPLLSRAMLRDPVHPPGDPPLAPPRVLLRRHALIGPAEQDFRDFLRGFRDRVRS